MTLLDLFNDKMFDFPHAGSSNFPKSIAATLAKYITLLGKVDDEYKEAISSSLNDIANICFDINEVLNLTYSGNLIKSYEVLNRVLSRIEVTLSEDRFPGNANDYLYRARIDDGTIYSSRDLFHRPFEQRFDIHSTRFSISGLPCLYLSNSIFTCWSELDKPLMEKMIVSRFQTYRPLKFLNLVPNYDWYRYVLAEITSGKVSEESIRAMKFTMDISIGRTLKIYPILLVCYTQVYKSNAVFKPEYMFPQLLMQWLILKPEYHGIKYMSNKTKPSGDWRNEFINYALPVKKIKSTGFCSHLSTLFKITKPLSLETVKLINPLLLPAVRNIRDLPLKDTSIIDTYNLADNHYKYSDSAFKLLEREIVNCEFNKLAIK